MAQAPDDNIEENKDEDEKCEYFFMYGTLRDDIEAVNPKEQATPWAEGWFQDKFIANYAEITGFQMFRLSYETYPFIVETKDKNDVILGRIIKFQVSNNRSKIIRYYLQVFLKKVWVGFRVVAQHLS